MDQVYLANVNYEDILPRFIGSDLYLGQNRIPQVRSSLNDTFSGYFLNILESEDSPSTLRIKDWTRGENYRHLQFVSADGVTFVLNETSGTVISQNDFTVVGLDRRNETNDI